MGVSRDIIVRSYTPSTTPLKADQQVHFTLLRAPVVRRLDKAIPPDKSLSSGQLLTKQTREVLGVSLIIVYLERSIVYLSLL